MNLRPYQLQAVGEIKKYYKTGVKKVLLHLSTGGGKTVCFSTILKSTAERGHACMMVVRGRKLVQQASDRLHREQVPHGVMMAGHWNYRPSALIQICSINTLLARKISPPAKLIVIDEAHMATSNSYFKFLAAYPEAFILAVTATPYTEKSLRHLADVVVKPITTKELIEQGFLVDARYFAPSAPDLTEVKISASTHDYAQDELALAMQKGTLVGDLVHHWNKLSESRATLCFAASIGHSKNIVAQFKQAGIAAEHCDCDTPEKERENIIGRLERGETKVVSNVGIFCTGVDIPKISCIILARPTKSYNLFIQMCGRGTRPSPGKSNFIILDHAGNVLEHGFITDEPEVNLDGTKITGFKKPKTCSECYAVYFDFKCPSCGYSKPNEVSESKEVITTEGQLKEITAENTFDMEVQRQIRTLEFTRKAKGYKKGWVYFKIVESYGEETANRFFPRRNVPSWLDRGAHSASQRNPRLTLTEAEHKMLEITKSRNED